MKKYAIIVAGGVGKRMQSYTPKQFMLLSGKPLLIHSVQTFFNCYHDIEIIVVLPKGYFDKWEKICKDFDFTIKHKLAEGGENRFYSVKSGLALIPEGEEGIVGIHDAARPLVNKSTIQRLYNGAQQYGNSIPVVPVNDSVRESTAIGSRPIDRSKLCFIQTPQCFKISIIKNAYQQDFKPLFTDDATVAESIGEKIHLIEGERNNIKITTPADLLIAEALRS
jgi:2-C-methyl-D-erythritol 4-phosphate cytidylyltransferase